MTTFREIIKTTWRSPDRLAKEIGAPFETARKWRHRNNIPAEWWLAIVNTQTAQAAGITIEQLAEAASNRQSVPNREPAQA